MSATMIGSILAAGLLLAPPGGVTVEVIDADREGQILLDVSSPREAEEEEIEILVNGAPSRWEEVGGGSGGGRVTRTISLDAGAPGPKEISVRVGQMQVAAQARLRFAPVGVILPSWIDGEIVFDSHPLRVRARYLELDEILVNGETAAFSFEKSLLHGFWTKDAVVMEPPLRPGENRIEIRGRAVLETGAVRPVARETSLYLAPGGRVRRGDTFCLVYGVAGSRSGPFYYTETEGSAIEEIGAEEAPDGRLSMQYRAAGPGAATIRIFVKPHFLEERRLEREIRLVVE